MELRIRELLRNNRESISAFANRVGITQANMSNIVNGKSSPTLDTLKKIADALGVPISDLFDRPESEHSDGLFTCPNCGTVLEVKKKE
jgi:transcriptional regulator with XRE-family HTH domain